MNNNFFSQHISKLKLEAIIRSALAGSAVGFGVNFVVATVFWFTGWGGLWLTLGIFAVVSALAGLFFYYKRFIPTDARSARRIDSLGLYERLITMVEYEKDESSMAKIQREDAKRALASVTKEQIKITISKIVLASFICCTILGVSMTTVNALSAYGVIPNGTDFFEEIAGDVIKVSYSVDYLVKDDKGGIIVGDDAQLVESGEDATTVTALADDGYVFKKWSDGSTNPTRTDTCISEDLVFTAEFAPLGEQMDTDSGDMEGDDDPNAPKNNQGQQGQGEEEGDGAPSNAITGAGKYKPNNQVINNSTYYREVIQEYQDEANERLIDEDSNLSDAEKEMIKKYLGIV